MRKPVLEPLRRAARLAAALATSAALVAACAQHASAPAPPSEQPPARAWSAQSLQRLQAAALDLPRHGLAADTARVAALDALDTASRHDPAAAAALDSAADALFASLARTFAQGAIAPPAADPDWAIPLAAAPNAEEVSPSLRSDGDVAAYMRALLPADAEYGALERELGRVNAEAPGAIDANGLSREQRIARLRVNLERWRWLPRTLPQRRIDVLIPFFEARLVGFGPAASHRVIVGVRRLPTPTFVTSIESVTLNPSWTPPSSILAAELLPRFRRNPAAAAAEGFEVFDASGRNLDLGTVDWSARPFPYTLRQRPGSGNALGRVRFDMSNAFAIYLHDTPDRALFERADRALSHGCIRVDAPVALAADVLSDPGWSVEALQTAINGGQSQTIPLSSPLPVYVLYFTAIADADGAVRYADDIYGRDRRLLEQLDHTHANSAIASGFRSVSCT